MLGPVDPHLWMYGSSNTHYMITVAPSETGVSQGDKCLPRCSLRHLKFNEAALCRLVSVILTTELLSTLCAVTLTGKHSEPGSRALGRTTDTGTVQTCTLYQLTYRCNSQVHRALVAHPIVMRCIDSTRRCWTSGGAKLFNVLAGLSNQVLYLVHG